MYILTMLCSAIPTAFMHNISFILINPLTAILQKKTFCHFTTVTAHNYAWFSMHSFEHISHEHKIHLDIIESVDSISKDERGFPLTQYITNGRISRGGYTFTHFKHHHRVLRLISYSMSV